MTAALVRLDRHADTVVLRLEAGRANAMGDDLLAALAAAWPAAAAPPTRAIVVTGQGASFSAGLALPELVDRDRDAMRAFIGQFAAVMDQIWCCPLPTVAAINGHAIAGGCVLALVCDARVSGGGGRIGLNETRLGIGLPAIVTGPLRQVLAPPAWGPVALEGRLFEMAAALRLGLVDELVEPGELDPRAQARAAELAAIPAAAYAQVKRALRVARDLAAERAQTEAWLDTWFDPEAQALLRAAAAQLRQRRTAG